MENATPIKFLNFIVRESHISFKKPGDYKIDINFEASGSVLKSTNKFILQLIAEVKDADGKFGVNIVTESYFDYDPNANIEEFKNSYFTINAPAIVFPYIRAYISSLTALSGMPTLNLPTLNLSSIGEDLKKNIQVLD